MSSFVAKESFKHKLAKELLCKWLNEERENKWCGDGAHMEYPLVPFMKNQGAQLIGYGYDNGDGKYAYYSSLNNDFAPTYEQCIANKDIPIAVLDIAIVYKGIIFKGFEIYHTHKVDEEKKEKIKELCNGLVGFELYEIDAETILKQCEKPKDILSLCKRIL